MDGTQFDNLIKRLDATRLTRLHALRGLAAVAVAGLTGLRLFAEADAAKDKPKKRKVCLCSAASCQTKKVKNRSKVINQNAPCAYAGACTSLNPCTQTPSATQTPSGCTPSCEQKICGDNGCGGSCGTCDTDQVCTTGRCASRCPGGQKVCVGNCIPNNQCCTNSDCPASSSTCCSGACVNVQTDVRNCGACGARCTVNMQCLEGACLCPQSFTHAPCEAPNTCCTSGECECLTTVFLDMTTCNGIQTSGCPRGTIECIATTNNCGSVPAPAKVCCPTGTTCTAAGTCLIN